MERRPGRALGQQRPSPKQAGSPPVPEVCMHRTLGQQLDGTRDAIIQVWVWGERGRGISPLRGARQCTASLLQTATLPLGMCSTLPRCSALLLGTPAATANNKHRPQPPTRVEVAAEQQGGVLATQRPRRQLAIGQCLFYECVCLLLRQGGRAAAWNGSGGRARGRARVAGQSRHRRWQRQPVAQQAPLRGDQSSGGSSG